MVFEPSSTFWRSFYDRVAFAYDAVLRAGAWLRLGSEARIRRKVIGRLEPATGSRVLEIGCGTASNRFFLPENIQYLGVDISFNMLNLAQRKCAKAGLSAAFVQADAAALPFPSGFANLAFAMGVYQHVWSPQNAIAQMKRVTKTGGLLLIIDERRDQKRILAASEIPESELIGEYFVSRTSKK